MEQILDALGNLILRALPTLALVALLHTYLKFVFVRPLERVLDARYKATAGAKKVAEESLARAAAQTTEYEEKLRAARAAIYQDQEQMHARLEQERAAQVASAREEAESAIREAREALAREAEQARAGLARESVTLAARIVETILGGRAA